MKAKQQPLFFLMMLMIGGVLMGGAVMTGCLVRGSASMHTEPQLVSVGSGLWVVEDYDEPVFYNDGFYWRYYGNTWYRSRVHNNDWVVVQSHSVPHVVVSIDRPTTYVHYHAPAGARVRRGKPGKGHHAAPRSKEHDNRSRGKPQPKKRDHGSDKGPKGHDHHDKKPKKRGNH